MIRYIIFSFIMLIACNSAWAQRLSYPEPKSAVLKPVVTESRSDTQAEKTSSADENTPDVAETSENSEPAELPPPPPSEMTLEQKAEIDTNAKINLNADMMTQTKGERSDVVDILSHSEMLLKRRQLLSEGKSTEEVNKEIKSMPKEKINTEKDDEMREYLYKKAGFIDEQ